MTLNAEQISFLLTQKPISDDWPWSTCDENEIDKHWKDILHEICRKLNLKHKSDFDHYGSGYSSYVDTWFYRETAEFKCGPENHYTGLVILYSRLSNFYVVGQGKKTWHVNSTSSSSYLPSFNFIDNFTSKPVMDLVPYVDEILKERGLVRLYKEDVSEFLDRKIKVPTVLETPPLHHFDAIFYWED